MMEFSSTLTHRLTSKIVSHCTVKSAPLTELGRADTDAAAVAQLVDRVENVYDIEADFDGSFLRDLVTAESFVIADSLVVPANLAMVPCSTASNGGGVK